MTLAGGPRLRAAHPPIGPECMTPIDFARRMLVATFAFAASAWATLALERASHGIAWIWVANALILGAAIRQPPRALAPLLAAVVLGTGIASVLIARGFVSGLVSGVFNALEIGLIYAAFRYVGLRPDARFTDRGLLVFFGVAVLAAPAVSGSISATVLAAHRDVPWHEIFVSWWMADAFGMFLVLPLLWTYTPEAARDLLRGPRALEFWTLTAVALLTAVFALTELSRPYVVFSLPLLVVALRSGVFGTALCNLLVVAVVLAVSGMQSRGVLPDPALAPHLPTASVWVFACMSVLGPLLVAVITAQRNAGRTEALRVAERLRVITDAVPAYIAELGPDLRYRFANARYLEWLGQAPAQMLGAQPADVLGEAPFRRLEPRMREALAGRPQRFEFDLPNGQHLDVAYEPLAENGGFVLMAHDVTRRVEAEKRFRRLLESAPDAMVVLDPASRRVLRVNRRAETTFGYTRDELVGASIDRFVEGADALEREAVRAHLDAGGSTGAIELVGRRRDGSAFPVEVVLSRLDGAEGAQLVAGLRDVSARHRTEQALHEERERAQVTLNSIGDAVITTDTQGRVTSLNPVAELMLGLAREDAAGRAFDDVVPLASPIANDDEARFTAALRAPDGRELHVDASHTPIRDRNGGVIGRVTVLRDVSEVRALAQRMSHLAHHDALTGLPNRVLLDDRLAQALAPGEHGGLGAVLYIDLDFFKTINDSLGHQVGDQVLQEVARRLAASVRGDDTVSRQGGDEFVVLLVRLKDVRDAARVASKLIRAVEAPMDIDGRRLHVSASIGIAVFPEDAQDGRTLTKQADTALYHAKQAGRSRYSYFTAVMSERADRRLRLENELRGAVANDQLFLVYQPKVELPSQRVIGLEALVRWRHPDGHVVPPLEFIPVAEETGLVLAIDEWVLREACRQLREWCEAGLDVVPVSVNLSLARFDPALLVDNVRRALADSGVAPAMLEVEFTESQMLGQDERAAQLIDGMRSLGVRLSVDDFGTGYSSLSYLTRHRFDTIKIDRSFVQGLPHERTQVAVVQAIMAMTRALGCRVVGEGVETDAQAQALLGLGCEQMQGYLFGRPVEPAVIARMLEAIPVAI